VTQPCATCHNGVTATGKGGGHFVTTLECNACHNTQAWTPIDFRHNSPNYPGDHNANLRCLDCHQGNSQVMTWPFPYQPDCAACHADDYRPDKHKKTENPLVFNTVSELRDCAGSCHIKGNDKSPEHRVTRGGW
jgi:hypothetical protein